MKYFVGIDLGTTNSAICSYDGTDTRIWKSPEQNDVTPSVIYIDRRGNKYIGKRAYDAAPHSPNNSAMLFKRLIGTSTPIELSALNITKTPEECSAEVLKVLFGYLPEEIRNDQDMGIVITVPAAFNQMQKDATMQAATMAGLGNVALMQEPVAAVMSVMRTRNADGMFLIYDLGGGTLDIAIAESISGRVNLLAHGGIAMCGGRDFDRALFDNIVRPWLLKNFDLPDDFSINPQFKALIRLAVWATERAKIELSAREEATISLSEAEVRTKDLRGEEIYLDIILQRDEYNQLIADRVQESINATRETLSKAGLSSHDMERIVFVGGPTNYKPLRDKVAFELGIPSNTDVNPMTAVAEGASLFAESIDWSTQSRSRKSARGQISSGGVLPLSFNFIARTPSEKAKVAAILTSPLTEKYEFQIDSVDTGWTSGRLALTHGANTTLLLAKKGLNTFKVFVFDSTGNSVSLENDKIVITRTAATVDAIPASHSIGIEVLNKLGGHASLDYLVRSGDALPVKGKKNFKAAEALKAGASNALNIKLWEGEIESPITDNRPIGVLKISGSDFDSGLIPAGADLECEYEILDSGNIVLEISVPCIGGVFSSGKNFYSRQEGQIDYTCAKAMLADESKQTLTRIETMGESIACPKLDQAKQKVEEAINLSEEGTETEQSQEAMEKIFEARRLLAQVRKENLKEIRQMDLDHVVDTFNEIVREHARPSECTSFDNLVHSAQRSLDRNDRDFEQQLESLRSRIAEILLRQDWFIILQFKNMIESPHMFTDEHQFRALAERGLQCVKNDNIDELRSVIASLYAIHRGGVNEEGLLDVANIIRG